MQQSWIEQGDRARDQRDWAAAAAAYERALAENPGLAPIWIQLGHARKEAGDLAAALAAYQRAAETASRDAEAHLQFGHALKLSGRRAEAIAAYVRACRLDPSDLRPRLELRGLAPQSTTGAAIPDHHLSRIVADVARMRSSLDRLASALPALETFRRYDPADHDVFVGIFRTPPAPRRAAAVQFQVVVALEDRELARARLTLESLRAQTYAGFTATIVARDDASARVREEALATDTRFRRPGEVRPSSPSVWIVNVPPGVVLDPECLAWFAATADPDAAFIFADSDHEGAPDRFGVARRSTPRRRHDFSLESVAQGVDAGPVTAVRSDVAAACAPALATIPSAFRARALPLIARRHGAWRHVPHFLATAPEPDAVRDAVDLHALCAALVAAGVAPPHLAVCDDAFAAETPRLQAIWRPKAPKAPVAIIIPSRDRGDLLADCLSSLRSCAASSERIEIIIVDNGSRDPATLALFDAERARGSVVIRADEPFNWPRLNALGVMATKAETLVFANNDLRMLTPGWDDIVRGFAEFSDLGALGVRLLYEDLTIQHAGVEFTETGLTRHVGVGRPVGEPGPDGVFARTRDLPAVTGAFFAVRRDVYDQLGGFDAGRFPVSFNDMDFCVRARALGKRIIYCPAITAIHLESVSRGFDRDPESKARLAAEQGFFQAPRR